MRKLLLICIFTVFITNGLFCSKTRKEIVSELYAVVDKWMGTPYVYGGDSRTGIDCSAFTNRVYTEVFNKDLPRTVAKQKFLGTTVTGNLQPGDLLFFNIDGKISHVGIFVFDNKFIHAASAGNEVGVIKSSLQEKYYRARFVYAKRLVDLPAFGTITLENDPALPTIQSLHEKESSTNDMNSNTITNKSDLVSFILGAVVYKGEIRDLTDSYISEREIKYSIENINHEKNHFIISILNLNTERERKIHLFDIKKNKKILKGFYLPKGNYAIKLKTTKNEIIFEKNIFIL